VRVALKRKVALVALVAGVVAGGSAILGAAPAQAKNNTWVCAGSEHANVSVCQGDPLPGGPLVQAPRP
jgi:hypothetical protein